MYTEQLIELFASAYAPQGWTECETCKVEYRSPMMAYQCYKAHTRVHERAYANIPLNQKKHEVAFQEDGKPLCRGCVRKTETSVSTTYLAEPPQCSRCGRQIEDPPFVETPVMKLPLHERHRDMILRPTREGLCTLQDYAVHKGLRSLGPSGSEVVDGRLFKEYGPAKPNGMGGIPRTEDGYIGIRNEEPVECKASSG